MRWAGHAAAGEVSSLRLTQLGPGLLPSTSELRRHFFSRPSSGRLTLKATVAGTDSLGNGLCHGQ